MIKKLISRRRILTGLAGFVAGGAGLTGFALAESYGLKVTPYRLTPPGWPRDLRLKLAVIADLHAVDPWMSVERIRSIVATTNALRPDAVLLLGDFVVGYRLAQFGTRIPPHVWAAELANLRAPHGVHAVLGNHDWWDSVEAQQLMQGPVPAQQALEAAGIRVYENSAVRLEKDGRPFWIAGLGDQQAFYLLKHRLHHRVGGITPRYVGRDDLSATLAAVTDAAPIILMAHEPDVFPDVPGRVALTVSGHTHGGQVRVLGYSPIVPSRYGSRYIYGHIVEDARHLIVSAGLGCSGAPIRLGAPPEVVLIDLGAPTLA